MKRISFRWTIGDVNISGFEALRLSVWGIWKIFGVEAHYTICVNSLNLDEAIFRTGDLPREINWLKSELTDIPEFIKETLHDNMAEGVAWKFSPLQVNPEIPEISLDNDCILWDKPAVFEEWLNQKPDSSILAEDVKACFGQFSDLCGPDGRNTGIRGILPHYDYEEALKYILDTKKVKLESELDEQGLQVAALEITSNVIVVKTDDVSICSPFPEHQSYFGKSGVHFVGLNAKSLTWDYYGRPAVDCIQENWNVKKKYLYEKIGIHPL